MKTNMDFENSMMLKKTKQKQMA